MNEKTVRIADLEAVIREMSDVEGAKVVADRAGSIEEIHVLVRGERNAKQIVRDIESSLITRFGLKIDHKKVSVVHVSGGMRSESGTNGKHPVIPAAGVRPELADISIAIDGSRFDATVHLSLGGRLFTGSASGHNTPRNQPRVLAEATARAIECALEMPDSILLDDIVQVKLPGDRVAVNVVVCLVCKRGDEHLLGAALVRQDVAKAAVHATLDAMNRRFSTLASRPSRAGSNGANNSTKVLAERKPESESAPEEEALADPAT